ncbi:MAG: methyltransferase domain-containing protein [Pseudomonadales bacterium]|nr:methyltransferase domain-containing protein [Pseudomonadales bacterium]
MNQSTHNPLACPVCRAPLQNDERSYYCPEGHSFDIARQGYLNLLLSHQKRSKHPGDSKEMVTARQAFLSEGHYFPIYAALEKLVLKHLRKDPLDHPLNIADLGCGEGYYTQLLDKKLRETMSSQASGQKPEQASAVQTWGLDISKDAIISACKHNSNVRWLIGNLTQTPFAEHSMDIATVLFCRVSPNELVRLLKPGGIFIFVKPDDGHLIQLREQIYSDVKGQKKNPSIEQAINTDEHPVQHPGLTLIDTQALTQSITLNKSESIQTLFKMTPHYWRTKPEQREKIKQLDQLNTDISVNLFCYQRSL